MPEALVATFDGGVHSNATTLVYCDLGYDVAKRWRIGVNVFNLLNGRASDIDYYYVSRLRGEPLPGVADIHTHSAEPREMRISVTARM